MFDTIERPRRAIVIGVQLPSVSDEELQSSLAELRRLARTLGIEVVGTVTQKRSSFDAGAYLGEGKRQELKALIGPPPGDDADAPQGDRRCDALLVDHEISPSQAHNLETEMGVDVLDRTQVILEIFHHHARSRAARAQVEIVRLEYLAPRLRESGKGKDRQRGGIGGKGAGESAMELDRR
jgi:GTPase